MTDEQFAKLLEVVSGNHRAAETLTRIDERLKNHLENYNGDRLDCAKEVLRVETIAKGAHKRVDTIIGVGGWTVFLTVSGLIITTLINMYTINEKRFDSILRPQIVNVDAK